MANELLVPARVHCNLDSSEISITDYDIAVVLDNGSKYVRSTNNTQGQSAYAICKGGGIKKFVDIKVSILKGVDKKFGESIKKLRQSLEATKDTDPEKYAKNIAFNFAANDDKLFANMKFQGYVYKITRQIESKSGLEEVIAHIGLYDSASFAIQ